MIPYNTIPEQPSPDINDPPLQNHLLVSFHSNNDNNNLLFSEHDDNHRPRFPLDESPGLQEIPNLPMFAISSSDEEEESDDNFSLVSSLSRDDSLLRFAPWQPPPPATNPTSLMMHRDMLAGAVAHAHQHPPAAQHAAAAAAAQHAAAAAAAAAAGPPMEIIVPVKASKKTSPVSVKPDWLRDDVDALPSPMSSMSYSSSDNRIHGGTMTRSLFSSTRGPITPKAEPSQEDRNIFRPALAVHTSLVNHRPELARRSVTFPETTTTNAAAAAFEPPSAFHPFAHTEPSYQQNDMSQDTSYCPIPPPPPQPVTFQRSKSLPNKQHFVSQDEDLLMLNVPFPVPNHPVTTTQSRSSSPEDVKLLGQRQNRAVGDIMLHHHGTVAGVGSIAGQLSFYTAPTTTSSTGDEGFQHHIKVQSMLNTLVLGGDSVTGASKTQRRRRKERKPFWNRFLGKQPPSDAIKQPAGFFS